MPSPFTNNPVAGDAAAATLDFFGVDQTLVTDILDPNAFGSLLPRTQTRTSHGFLIRVAGGRVIGAAQGVNFSFTRQVDEEYEIDQVSNGTPVDMIPQNLTGRRMSIRRYDLWTQPMEQSFGTGFEYTQISDQRRPFAIQEIWRSPVGILLGGRRVYQYNGCYFASLGREVAVEGSRIIMANAEVVFANRVRVI